MPTIIDELVTVVRLDPRGFSEGQRKVLDDLAKLRSSAASSAQGVGQQTVGSLRGYMSALHSELKDVNLQLLNLQSTSRRSGEAVRAGGKSGAEGLTNLAQAAAFAYAGLKTVQETIATLGAATNRAFAINYTAKFTGISPDFLQRLENANYSVGNVSKEQTDSALFTLTQAQATYRNTGKMPPEFNNLVRWFKDNMPGIDLAHAAPQDILSAVAKGAVGPKGPDLMMYLRSAGLGDFATLMGSGRYESSLKDAGSFGLTDEQLESLNKLGEAARRASEAWDKLIGSVVAAHPEWTKAITEFTNLLTTLSGSPEKMYALGTAFEVVVGATMIAAVGKFVQAVIAGNSAILATPFGRFLMAGYLVSKIYDEVVNAQQHPEQYAVPDKKPGEKDEDEGWFGLPSWSWIKRNWGPMFGYSGGAPGATPGAGTPGAGGAPWTAPSATPGASSAADPRGVEGALRASAARYGFNPDDIVAMAGQEGLHAAQYATMDSGAYSYGALQMHIGGLADEFQKATGLDPSKPENEIAMNDWAVRWMAQNPDQIANKWSSVRNNLAPMPRRTASLENGAPGVDSSLDQAVHYASSHLPPGYTAKMTSGVRNEPGSQHALGKAEDWQIYGPDGQPVSNRGGDITGLYGQMYKNALRWMKTNHPDLFSQLGWGGHFGTQLGGGGPPDLMHFDLGGRRGHFGDPNAEYRDIQNEQADADRSPFPYWVKRNARGQPYELNMTAEEKARDAQSYAFIKSHPTSWLRGPTGQQTPTSNDNSIANNVHAPVTVNVSGNGTDGYKLGGAIADQIQRRMIVSNSNAGTSG